MNRVIYIFGELGSGKTLLSDRIEEGFLSIPEVKSCSVNDSNLQKIISQLAIYKDAILIIQSNLITKEQFQAFKRFVKDSNFSRGVIIQSEFKPDPDIIPYCDQIYETGLPLFSWVTQIGEKLWKATSADYKNVLESNGRNQAIELVRNYTAAKE